MKLPGAMALLCASLLFCPVVAAAGPAGDAIFVERLFSDLSEGEVVSYRHDLSGADPERVRLVEDGRITLTAVAQDPTGRWQGPVLRMRMSGGGATREVGSFPASGGNPALILFLESTVRNIAAETGGNPQYIRVRIREALQQGGELIATAGGDTREAVFRPFEGDARSEDLGAFASLTLRVVLSDAVPGRFLSLSADTAEGDKGYRESIAYLPADAAP